jgi:hypothetical protein
MTPSPHLDTSLTMLTAVVSRRLSPQNVPGESWPAVIRQAYQNGLSQMLLWVVKQEAPELTTGALWEPVISATRGAAVQHILLEAAQIKANTALREANIPAIWLKGIALAQKLYPQPALRPMGDLDVLVPFERREEALHILQSLGYAFYYDSDRHLTKSDKHFADESMHHYHLHSGSGTPVILELHFQLFPPSVAPNLGYLPWLWEQTELLDAMRGLLILKPEAQLLHLCVHALLQHGETVIPLIAFFDIHQLLSQTTINWSMVIDRAVEFGWTFVVDRALRHTSELFGTPVPADVLAELHARRPAGESIYPVVMLEGKGARWEHMKNYLATMTLEGQIREILKTVVPPRVYMRNRYAIRGGRMVWPYYFRRWFDQGGEVLAWIRRRYFGRHIDED